MPRQDEHAFLRQVLLDNTPAVEFIETLARISQTLDDLVDGDRSLSQHDVLSCFWQALIELPANPFYRQHEPYLRPIMASVLQDWRDSVVLERSDDLHNRTLAFVMRDQMATLITQCAYLVGGHSWMTRVSVPVRQHVHEEMFEDYLDSLGTPRKEEAS